MTLQSGKLERYTSKTTNSSLFRTHATNKYDLHPILYVNNAKMWVYREAKRRCLEPFKERAKYYKDYSADEETRDTIERITQCAGDMLDKYCKFSTNAMSDDEINKFHIEVVNGLKKAIDTKKEQYERAFEELDEAEDDLEAQKEDVCNVDSDLYNEDECNTVLERLDRVKSFREQLKRAKTEDMNVLNTLLKTCETAKDRVDKAVCIDEVFYTVHSRGTLLPLMCGAPLEEYVEQAVYDTEGANIDEIGNVAVDMAKDTQEVLTCLRNFKP